MRTATIACGACLLCALCACSTHGGESPPQEETSERHRISGTVSGLAQADVTMVLGGDAVGATTTATPDGNYAFDDLADGIYTITPSRSGVAFTPAAVSLVLRGHDVVQNFAVASAARPRFEFTGSMAVPRAAHTATLLQDGKVLVAGGYAATRGTVNGTVVAAGAVDSAELFDPVTGTFRPTGSMARPRVAHQAFPLQDGRVLVVGGGGVDIPAIRAETRLAADFELFDPATGTFSAAGGGCGGVGALLPSGDVYFTAGCTFHPATGQLSPAARFEAPYESTATALPDGTVLLTGGSSWPEYDLVQLYDPTSGGSTSLSSWGCRGSLVPTATLLNDGTVLVQRCDRTQPGPGLSDVVAAIFTPGTRSFEVLGSAPVEVEYGSATVLATGEVLIWPPAWGLALFLFDPASRTFADAARLPDVGTPPWEGEVMGGRPTRLADGRVLVKKEKKKKKKNTSIKKKK